MCSIAVRLLTLAVRAQQFNIPELLEVVKDWDHEVRKGNPEGLWFANLSTETESILTGLHEAGEHRDTRARKDLRDWINKVGLPYHSPHKFRHGFAVYAIKNSDNYQDFKAVSQNLMHANLSITDGVYGIFSNNDVKAQITNLGGKVVKGGNLDLTARLKSIEESINQLKKKMGA